MDRLLWVILAAEAAQPPTIWPVLAVADVLPLAGLVVAAPDHPIRLEEA